MTRAEPGTPLTAREREIAGLVAQGLTDQEIATGLCVSLRTVHAHLRNAYAKTETGSRVRLINWLAPSPCPPFFHAREQQQNGEPMTNYADLYPGEKMRIHVERAATVTARMPTPEELKRGYTPGTPLLIVADGGPHDKVFSAQLVELAFDDPHPHPGADAARAAVASVLGAVGEQLGLVHAQIDELANAARHSPRAVTRVAALARAEQDADHHSPDGMPGSPAAAVI